MNLEQFGSRRKVEKILDKQRVLGGQHINSFSIIESITVKNFMCHSNLTMEFKGNSNVNFVVGCNGSGKSAMLTAIIVGLGGKTGSTSRGTSLRNFIKTGCRTAVIRTVLRNDGDDVVNADTYGNRIIVERKITIDGCSTYKLKSADNKLISTKLEDLTFILDQLNIYINNPLTCLNQELSKNFLHTKNESDKYNFFLKTTQLEQLSNDYSTIKKSREILEKSIKRHMKALPELEKVVLDKLDKFRELSTLRELKLLDKKLRDELAWSHVIQQEQLLRPIEKELGREKERAKLFAKASRKYEDREGELDDQLSTLNGELAEVTTVLTSLGAARLAAARQHDDLRDTHRQQVNDRQKVCRQHDDLARQFASVTAQVARLKSLQQDNRPLAEYNRQMQELGRLKTLDSELRVKLCATDKAISELSSSMISIRENSDRLKRDLDDKQEHSARTQRSLESLTQGERSKLQLYGYKMPELIRRIDDAYQRRMFRQRPRGPIGSYLSVSDADAAVPVECAVRKLLFAFIVDNPADEKRLERLRNTVFSPEERSRYTIYIMKFSDVRYDVNRNKARHHKYSTVLEVLNVPDPVVANCLVDIANIETQLIIPDTQQALQVMQVMKSPLNCTRALTKVGDEVYPDRFYSNQRKPVAHFLGVDVTDKIQRKSEDLKRFQEEAQRISHELSATNAKLASIQTELDRQKRRKQSLVEKLTNTKAGIRRLQILEKPVTIDWKELEDEARNLESQVATTAGEKEKARIAVEASCQAVEKGKEALQAVDAEYVENGCRHQILSDKVHIASESLHATKAEHEYFEENRRRNGRRVEMLQKSVDELRDFIADISEKAKIVRAEKVHTQRPAEHIEKEISLLRKRIKQHEGHGNRDVIVREATIARNKLERVKREIDSSTRFHKKVVEYLRTREGAFEKMRGIMGVQCVIDFDMLLRQRNFIGELEFNHDARTIRMVVSPKDDRRRMNNFCGDVRALSGGERSFSTVCFILALWQVMQSPLRCLDEFDVFMDMANRRVAMEMMVDMALLQPTVQFLFLTPHDISALPVSERIHVWRMADPKRDDDVMRMLPPPPPLLPPVDDDDEDDDGMIIA